MVISVTDPVRITDLLAPLHTPEKTVAVRVVAIDRPGLLEQFWEMGLASNIHEWERAMRRMQLPLFNTAYADRDGHIGFIYNAALPLHPQGDFE